MSPAERSPSAASVMSRQDGPFLALIVGAWMLFLWWQYQHLSQAVVDDAFIILRVVDNIWHGRGWTYNVCEAVNPVTSPFYAWLLLVLRALSVPAEPSLSVAYALGLVALSVGVYLGCRHRSRWLALVMAGVAGCASVPLRSWGMETSVLLALVVFAVLALEWGRHGLAGALCAMAALTRPEGMALVGILLLFQWLDRRTVSWRLLAGFLLFVLPWFMYAFWAHGRLIPNSVSVKAMQGSIGWFATMPTWFRYFLGQIASPAAMLWLVPVGLVLAFRDWHLRRWVVPAFLVLAAMQVAAYSILKAPPGYFWYLAPGNMALDMLLCLGAWGVLRWAWRVWMPQRPMTARLEQPALAVMVLWLAMSFGAAPPVVPEPYRHGDAYRKVGEWIARHTPADAVVAATEIGYIGYFSQRPIRDVHGLIHPQAMSFLQKEQWDWWFVKDPPDVVVVHNPPWDGEPGHPNGWQGDNYRQFQQAYELRATFSPMLVYVRSGL